ncbi:MAG TPA: RluA family pseudouridine synthase [Candidatus Acidoferrales bacterium]|nr:RluA family pseudouridine synthase [Candidatus Acidoferrales bacterium]
MAESGSPARRFIVGVEDAGSRVDRYLAARLPEFSRTRIQQELARGRIRVSGGMVKPSHRLEAGESIELALVPEPPRRVLPEAIPLEILYEDQDFAAVNKPAGIVVHPGAGIRSGTLAAALLHRYGRLSSIGGPDRPGIVHRLDKGTSGVLLIARHDQAHQRLARQFLDRRVEKTYLVLVHGRVEHDTGRIALAVSRDLRRRTRMTTRRPEGRSALTTWRVLAHLGPAGQTSPQPGGRLARDDGAGRFTLLEAKLHTGRTHQIRVHFSALGHPVVGDVTYGAPRRVILDLRPLVPPPRPWLHSARIRFAHPRTGLAVDIRAPLPADLRNWLGELVRRLGAEEAKIDRILQPYL